MLLKRLFFLFFLYNSVSHIHAQSVKTNIQSQLQQAERHYIQKKINDTTFLNRADSLVFALIELRESLSSSELMDILTLFKKVAWEAPAYDKYRSRYFRFLAVNANIHQRVGECFFFAEKFTQEEKNAGRNSLFELYMKVLFYESSGGYAKITALYHQHRDILDQYCTRIGTPGYDFTNIRQLINIYNSITNAYIFLQKADSTKIMALKAESCYNTFARLKNTPEQMRLEAEISTVVAKTRATLFNKEFETGRILLNTIDTLVEQHKRLKIPTSKLYIWFATDLRMRYYTLTQKSDSVIALYNQFTKLENLGESGNLPKHAYANWIAVNNKDYKTAYDQLDSSYKNLQKRQTNIALEMEELLYAHTEAEYNRRELLVAELGKKNRTYWIICIGLISSAIITFIQFRLRKEKKKTKLQLQLLNDAINTPLQVMQEIQEQTSRKEQDRLAKDLHDDLSPNLASIAHRLNFLITDTNDLSIKNELTDIQQQIQETYTSIRNKSHNWSLALTPSDEAFERKISRIINDALPNQHYQKNILVAEGTMKFITLPMRIELLRIIKEAITNIIKHAKAKTVSIALYEENDYIIMNISDDGKGFNFHQTKKGLGLISIEERAKKINGTIHITSSQNGTNIDITIPTNTTLNSYTGNDNNLPNLHA